MWALKSQHKLSNLIKTFSKFNPYTKSVLILRDDGREPYALFKKQLNHTPETMI